MTAILNVFGFRQRDDEDIENQNDGANNATSALLLPFEKKASAIRENVEEISGILDEIPTTATDEFQHDINVHAESLLQIETKLQSMQKEIIKLQKQNNKFAKTYWVRYPSMVRMQNSRFADVVQHVRRMTDATSEVHSKYQAVQKELLHKNCTQTFPDASHDDIKAFVEGWRHGDKLLENDISKFNYTPVIAKNEVGAKVSAADKKKLRIRRDEIQAMSRKLMQLYYIMHDLSKILSEHEEMAAKIDNNIEESLFTLKDGEGNSNEANDEQNGTDRSYMQQIRKENKIAFGLTLGFVVLWLMLREMEVF